ncbi:hypothetical protein PVAP13_9KG435300 [Panicum virgatum]|uniref:Uncharacterized protein n=1 Tax=Panicum virgatum TaxID=38727 RepID=A0A8T0NRC9_PANVG|nr:hypothetical protein PVAP13_9KG435300 [Panicum virgatum]
MLSPWQTDRHSPRAHSVDVVFRQRAAPERSPREGQPWLLRHPRRAGAPGGTAWPVRSGMRSRLRGQELLLLASLIPSQLSRRWPGPLDAATPGSGANAPSTRGTCEPFDL